MTGFRSALGAAMALGATVAIAAGLIYDARHSGPYLKGTLEALYYEEEPNNPFKPGSSEWYRWSARDGNPYPDKTPEASAWAYNKHNSYWSKLHDAEGFPVVSCQPAPGPICSSHTGAVVTGMESDSSSGSHPLPPRKDGLTRCYDGTNHWAVAGECRGWGQ